MQSVPYMFDTITSKDSLSVASQNVSTNRMIGIMLAKVKCEFRIIRVANNEISSRAMVSIVFSLFELLRGGAVEGQLLGQRECH